MEPPTPEQLHKMYDNLKVIMVGLYGDPRNDMDLGMIKKVDILFDFLTKGKTITGFFSSAYKLFVSVGVLIGTWIIVTNFMQKP